MEEKNEQKELQLIVDYLNERYTQKACWFEQSVKLPKEEILFNCPIAYWSCGAITIIKEQVHFIRQDDLYWFISNEGDISFHYSYCDEVADALIRTKKLHETVNKL